MAVENARCLTGVGVASGIEGGGGAGCEACSRAVVVLVLAGPLGFESEPVEVWRSKLPFDCAGGVLDSSVLISTGVELGNSSPAGWGC